jgi:hypothetical protein
MSDQQPATPPGPHTFVSILLFLLGILLLPGLCSLYAALIAIFTLFVDPQSILALFADPQSWEFVVTFIVGLVIGAGGVALIRLARPRLWGL